MHRAGPFDWASETWIPQRGNCGESVHKEASQRGEEGGEGREVQNARTKHLQPRDGPEHAELQGIQVFASDPSGDESEAGDRKPFTVAVSADALGFCPGHDAAA